MEKRVHIFFSGRVQGVFFRVTVKQQADCLCVMGWVRNLSDGRVELMAEAEEVVLHDFLNKIRELFNSFICEEDITWDQSFNEFQGFRVMYTR